MMEKFGFASVVVVKREVRRRAVVERSFMVWRWRVWVGCAVVIAFDDVVGIGWRVVWGFICIGTWVHWCCYIQLATTLEFCCLQCCYLRV